MTRRARHRAERPLSAAHVGMALLPALAVVMAAMAVQSASPAHPAELSPLSAHTATHAARGQHWPVVSPSVPVPPVTIDAFRASR